MAFLHEIVEAKVVSFEWEQVEWSEETFIDNGRIIPFLHIRLPKSVELKVYGSHLNKATDHLISHLVEKNRNVALDFVPPPLLHVPDPKAIRKLSATGICFSSPIREKDLKIVRLLRGIASDKGASIRRRSKNAPRFTFYPFGLICDMGLNLWGPHLNGILQNAINDPDFSKIHQNIQAIKGVPESAKNKPSLFNDLWQILFLAIRQSDWQKFKNLQCIMKALEDEFPTKLEDYRKAIFSSWAEIGRIPTAKEIHTALNLKKSAGENLRLVYRNLNVFRLGWIVGSRPRN